jgi:hypothetical protein
MNANKLASRRIYTLAIVMLVNMIYALIVKLTNTKKWKIRRLKLRLMWTGFSVIVAIKWIRNKDMTLSMLYNVMDVQQ